MSKNLIVIKIIIVTFFYFFITANNNFKKPFTRINVSYKSPDGISDTTTYSFSTSIFISYYDNYKLYELPYHVTQEVDNVLIYDSVKYDYFVHNTKNNFGYFLKKLNDSFVKKFRTDSILLRSYNGGNSLNGDILSGLKITNSIVLNADSEKLIYKYIVEDKMYDSVYLYYNKNLKDIELALSSYRDSVVNSKLYKVQFFIKKGKIAPYIPEDFYENVLEMKLAPTTEQKKLISMIERFKNFEKSAHGSK